DSTERSAPERLTGRAAAKRCDPLQPECDRRRMSAEPRARGDLRRLPAGHHRAHDLVLATGRELQIVQQAPDIRALCEIAGAGERQHRGAPVVRSEEHTSELQSQSNLVCRLLLEKKKQSQTQTNNTPT